jgi:polysaccharide export outer membrane protein
MKSYRFLALSIAAAALSFACSGPVADEPSSPDAKPAVESAAPQPPAPSVSREGPPRPVIGNESPTATRSSLPPEPKQEDFYWIGPGDRLEIVVYQHSDLSGTFEVLSDGTIRYPLIGSVHLASLSVQQASEKIETALEEKYLVDAQVNLTVKEYRSKPINVLGAVRSPGKYYLKAQTSLMDMITEAGGPTNLAGDTVVLTRRIVDRNTGNSYSKTFTLSLTDLLKGQSSDLDIPIVDGDTINLPERMLFYVSGEVNKPGPYRLESGMTLLKAISAAGGLGKFATKRNVEIHRKVAGEEQVLRFNVGGIESQDEPDPPVLADDMIIVARRFF